MSIFRRIIRPITATITTALMAVLFTVSLNDTTEYLLMLIATLCAIVFGAGDSIISGASRAGTKVATEASQFFKKPIQFFFGEVWYIYRFLHLAYSVAYKGQANNEDNKDKKRQRTNGKAREARGEPDNENIKARQLLVAVVLGVLGAAMLLPTGLATHSFIDSLQQGKKNILPTALLLICGYTWIFLSNEGEKRLALSAVRVVYALRITFVRMRGKLPNMSVKGSAGGREGTSQANEFDRALKSLATLVISVIIVLSIVVAVGLLDWVSLVVMLVTSGGFLCWQEIRVGTRRVAAQKAVFQYKLASEGLYRGITTPREQRQSRHYVEGYYEEKVGEPIRGRMQAGLREVSLFYRGKRLVSMSSLTVTVLTLGFRSWFGLSLVNLGTLVVLAVAVQYFQRYLESCSAAYFSFRQGDVALPDLVRILASMKERIKAAEEERKAAERNPVNTTGPKLLTVAGVRCSERPKDQGKKGKQKKPRMIFEISGFQIPQNAIAIFEVPSSYEAEHLGFCIGGRLSSRNLESIVVEEGVRLYGTESVETSSRIGSVETRLAFLPNDTVLSWMRAFNGKATEKQIWAAIEKVGLADVIREHGLNARLQNNFLTPGQQVLLNMARYDILPPPRRVEILVYPGALDALEPRYVQTWVRRIQELNREEGVGALILTSEILKLRGLGLRSTRGHRYVMDGERRVERKGRGRSQAA